MATSSRNRGRWLLAACALAGAAGQAHADHCERISNTFFVTHWSGGTPRSVSFEILKGTAGNKVAIPVAYSAAVKEGELERAGTVLVLTSTDPLAKHLLGADDYRIVIDGKTQYLVHDIRMTDRFALGCPFESAMVNQCKLDRSGFVTFESQCGEPQP